GTLEAHADHDLPPGVGRAHGDELVESRQHVGGEGDEAGLRCGGGCERREEGDADGEHHRQRKGCALHSWVWSSSSSACTAPWMMWASPTSTVTRRSTARNSWADARTCSAVTCSMRLGWSRRYSTPSPWAASDASVDARPAWVWIDRAMVPTR